MVGTASRQDEPRFSAFLCHSGDVELARLLKRRIETFGRRWFQSRQLRLFLDESVVVASGDLWASLREGLDSSRLLVLLASPDAAASPWVSREIDYWLRNNPASSVRIVIARGETGDPSSFGLRGLVPASLLHQIETEPKIVDLRSAVLSAEGAESPRFDSAVIDLVCSLRQASGLSPDTPDEVAGEAAAYARRRARGLRWLLTGVTTVAVALGILALSLVQALDDAQIARDQEAAALLAAEARGLLGDDDGAALQRAVDSVDLAETPATVAALRAVLSATEVPISSYGEEQWGWSDDVSFSPDATRIAAIRTDGVVDIWDWESGELVVSMSTPATIESLAYYSDSDIYISDSDQTIWHVELPSGTMTPVATVRDSASGHSTNARLIANASGNRMLYQRADRLYRISVSGDGNLIEALDQQNVGIAVDSVDGMRFSWGNNTVTAWSDGLRVPRRFRIDTQTDSSEMSPISNMHGIPGEPTQLGIETETEFLIVDLRSGLVVSRWNLPPDIYDLEVTPDGQNIVTGSDDATVRILTIDGDEVAVRGFGDEVFEITLSPNGRQFAATTLSKTYIMDYAASIAHVITVPGTVYGFTPEHSGVIVGDRPRLFRLSTLAEPFEMAPGRGILNGADVSESNRSIAYENGGRAVVADLDTGSITTAIPYEDTRILDNVTCAAGLDQVAMTNDGRQVATSDCDGGVRVHDSRSGAVVSEILSPSVGYISNGDVSSIVDGSDATTLGIVKDILFVDGSGLLIAFDHGFEVWSTNSSPRRLAKQPFPHLRAIAEGGGLIAASRVEPDTDDATIGVWRNGGREHVRSEAVRAYALDLHPTDGRLVYATAEGVFLSEDENAIRVGELPGVRSVRFAAGGDYLALGTEDGFGIVWTLRGLEVARVDHNGGVNNTVTDVAMTVDGTIVSTSYKGVVTICRCVPMGGVNELVARSRSAVAAWP